MSFIKSKNRVPNRREMVTLHTEFRGQDSDFQDSVYWFRNLIVLQKMVRSKLLGVNS